MLAPRVAPVMRSLRARSATGDPDVAPELAEPLGSGFTEIVIKGRSWPRRQVLDAAVNSFEPFIVFRRLGETAGPEDLIALARDSGAFAVGRQMAWSGWRKTIVARHPFRKLQPEEVTQVLAPWSPLLVVRRDLLLRFGIPRAVTFGGALLVLYWKAAAAGMQCLIAGQAGAITQEPAMELEDAELAFRLYFSRGLQPLAPVHPKRIRGNVSCAPAFRQTFRTGLPRVLIVSPYLPFPLSHGGAVRMYNLCRATVGRSRFRAGVLPRSQRGGSCMKSFMKCSGKFTSSISTRNIRTPLCPGRWLSTATAPWRN